MSFARLRLIYDLFFLALFTSVLTGILNRVRKWEDLGNMRSFVKQREIKLGLDESYRELKAYSMRFNVRSLFSFSLHACASVPVCADVTTIFWTYR
jgi:hypothetical protein